MRYWLMKTEPNEFSIDDLANRPNQSEPWDGVRNYQARNFMRDDMQIGDQVLFYHSRIDPSVVGMATVSKTSHPDFTAWDKTNKHFDPRSTPEKPLWFMVEVTFQSKFPEPIPLKEIKEIPGLEKMMLIKKGCRLSIQPVTKEEFEIIVAIGDESTPK